MWEKVFKKGESAVGHPGEWGERRRREPRKGQQKEGKVRGVGGTLWENRHTPGELQPVEETCQRTGKLKGGRIGREEPVN